MARRLFIFSIGFLMGCVLVYVMLFKDTERDFYGSWLPEGRVLKKLNSSLNRTHPTYKCILNNQTIFESEVDFMLEEGEIDFEKSTTDSEPKVYYTSIELEGDRTIMATIALENDSAWIVELGVGRLIEHNCD